MRVGVISDLHANLEATKVVLNFLNSRNVELIICAGDLVGFGANPNEVIGLLRKQKVLSVMGNYDEAVAYDKNSAGRVPSTPKTEELKRSSLNWTKKNITLRNKEYLKALPWLQEHQIEGKVIKVLHAGQNYLDEWITPEDKQRLKNLKSTLQADIIIIGHTHQAFTHTVGNTLFLNPGAVGRSLNLDIRASFAILDTDTGVVEFNLLDYDIKSTIRAIQGSGMDAGVAELIRYGVPSIERLHNSKI